VNATELKSANLVNTIQLKNPPIIEAVIGIDTAILPESMLEQFESLKSEMAKLGYTSSKPITTHRLNWNFAEGGDPTVETHGSQIGLRFEANNYAAQFKRDGFLFSRLGHYENWEGFTGESRRTWEVYSRAIGPAEFKEFGVRYINKVHLPNGRPLEQFLKVYPLLSERFPQEINESFMRLGFAISNPEGKFIHQHILLPPEREGHATVLLDNDFRFSAIGLTPPLIWDRIDSVRKIKDDYFFALITDELRDSFNV
jgi:uncharacterized protein (TIGR04255 family)